MAKNKTQKITKAEAETDSKYLLKIVLFILLGMIWLRVTTPFSILGVSISAFPIGLIVAFILIRHDAFAIDRKIEYPLVIIATIISFFLTAGIVI